MLRQPWNAHLLSVFERFGWNNLAAGFSRPVRRVELQAALLATGFGARPLPFDLPAFMPGARPAPPGPLSSHGARRARARARAARMKR